MIARNEWSRIVCIGGKLLLMAWGICVSAELWAQEKSPALDSLIQLFEQSEEDYQRGILAMKIGKLMELTDLEAARPYYDQALALGQKNGFEDILADAYRMLALYHYTNGNVDKSLQHNDSAFAHYATAKDSQGLVAIYNNKGLIYRQNGECLKATQIAQEAMRINEQMGDSSLADTLMLNYVEILWNCQQHEEALSSGKKGLRRVREKGDRYMEGQYLATLGSIYFQLEMDDSCAHYHELALQISQELEDRFFYSACLNNLGLIYMYTGKYAEAESLLLHSYAIDDEMGNYKRHASTYINLGVLAGLMQEYPKAIRYYLQGIDLVDKYEKDIYLIDIYKELARAYEETRQHAESFHFHKLAYELQDSLLSANIQGRIKELDKKFQTEKIKKELLQTQMTSERRKDTMVLALIGALGASLLAFFVYLYILSSITRKKAREEKRRIQLEYQILQAQMNPHFIFNSLNSIQGFFAENDFDTGNEYLEAFGKLIRRVMEESAFEQISLERELQTLGLYLQLEQLRLHGQLFFELSIEDQIDGRELYLPPLILQPFVENAIWHGIVPKKAPGKVSLLIEAGPDNQFLQVRIRDDGIGLNNKKSQLGREHPSRGISISRERLGREGDIQIREWEDKNGQTGGTEVSMLIPIEKKKPGRAS